MKTLQPSEDFSDFGLDDRGLQWLQVDGLLKFFRFTDSDGLTLSRTLEWRFNVSMEFNDLMDGRGLDLKGGFIQTRLNQGLAIQDFSIQVLGEGLEFPNLRTW